MLYLPREEGQGLVEYALILVLVAVVAVMTLNMSLGGSAHGEMKQFAGLEIKLLRGALERATGRVVESKSTGAWKTMPYSRSSRA